MARKHIDKETGEPYALEMTPELQADLERHWSSECIHPQMSIRRAVVANGAVQIRNQCVTCGSLVGPAIKKTAAPPDCPDRDSELSDNYQRTRESALEAIYQRHIRKQKRTGAGYQDRYQAYLKSDVWASKKQKVLARGNNVCEGCLEAAATQIHHKTYAHVFDELLYELVALCDACHGRAHTFEPVTENEHQELPCFACRYGLWGETEGSRCGKFEISTGVALSHDGPCGPNARELEPLK